LALVYKIGFGRSRPSRYGYLTKLQSRPDGKDAVILTYAIGPDKGEGKKDITVRLVQVDTKWLIDSIDEE